MIKEIIVRAAMFFSTLLFFHCLGWYVTGEINPILWEKADRAQVAMFGTVVGAVMAFAPFSGKRLK